MDFTKKRLFGTNGIRGTANVDLTPQVILKIAMSIGTFFGGRRILVGRDGRTSGEMITAVLKSGLVSTGCSVFDAGLAPTPCVQFTVRLDQYDGAVIVTASHNPPEYNGLKVAGGDGIELSREDEEKIEKLFFEERWVHKDWNNLGSMGTTSNILQRYRGALESHVDSEAVRRSRIRVVVDAANGVGALVTPQLLSDLGCEVQTVNSAIDGTFPGRLPEPTPANLRSLAEIVRSTGADLGVAHDGDADRAIFVSEAGEVQWGDRTFALIEKHFLTRYPGETIVTPISSSQVVRDVAEQQGGKVEWTKVGSINVSRRMQQITAQLGGEENGGIFYGPHVPVRDGAMAAAMIVDILARTGRRLSELVRELPYYHNIKTSISCPEDSMNRILLEVAKRKSDSMVETIDGVKVWPSKNSWVLIRASGTEPLLRVFVEAPSENEARILLSEYTSLVQDLKGELDA